VPRFDTRIRRVLLDPATGTTVETGAAGYTPSPALRRFVTHRDGCCRAPGCARAAKRGSARVAAALYRETAESVDEREQAADQRRLSHRGADANGRRPTKRDRRQIEALRRGHQTGW